MWVNQDGVRTALIYLATSDLLLIIGAIVEICVVPDNREGNRWLFANLPHVVLVMLAYVLVFDKENTSQSPGITLGIVGVIALILDVVAFCFRLSDNVSCSNSRANNECHEYSLANWFLMAAVGLWAVIDVGYVLFGFLKYMEIKQDRFAPVPVAPTTSSSTRRPSYDEERALSPSRRQQQQQQPTKATKKSQTANNKARDSRPPATRKQEPKGTRKHPPPKKAAEPTTVSYHPSPKPPPTQSPGFGSLDLFN